MYTSQKGEKEAAVIIAKQTDRNCMSVCVIVCVCVVTFKPLFIVCRCLIYGESLGKITHTPRCRWQCNRTHNKYLCRRFLFCVLCNYTRTHTVATLTTLLAQTLTHTCTHTHTTICTHYSSYFLLPEHLRLLLGKQVHIFTFPCIHYARCGSVCVFVCVQVCALCFCKQMSSLAAQSSPP